MVVPAPPAEPGRRGEREPPLMGTDAGEEPCEPGAGPSPRDLAQRQAAGLGRVPWGAQKDPPSHLSHIDHSSSLRPEGNCKGRSPPPSSRSQRGAGREGAPL